jgi:aldehyde:ferredoxin oxidoreductase
MGAVMGSKKIKAVVARGNKKPPIADEEGYKAAREKMAEILKFSMVAEGFRAFGSNVHMEYGMAIGDVPVKNWREAYWEGGPEKLGGTSVAEKILSKTHSCFACPIGCKRIVEVKTGPFAMEEGPGSEYEAAAALGTLQRMDNLEANSKANELCNRMGMDVISSGSTIAYATEAYQAGLITDADTGGIKLDWNQPEVLLDLLEKTARREGFGGDLAEGTRAMSEKYGGEEFAIQVKGMECPMHDPRALWGMALTYATSIRGACHCADSNLYVDLGLLNHKDLGVKRTWPYRSKGKAAQTIAGQKKGVLSNSAVICQYAWNAAGGGLDLLAAMINPVTGFDYSVEDLGMLGDRIWYIKRAIGNLCGATREDDRVPQRLLGPHPEGITSNLGYATYPTFMSMGPLSKLRVEGMKRATVNMMNRFVYPNLDKILRPMRFVPGLHRDHKALEAGSEEELARWKIPFDEMIEEYYRLRDIDSQGRPSRARLERYGLGDVARALHG